jgi:Ca-activated chloride channel family protein
MKAISYKLRTNLMLALVTGALAFLLTAGGAGGQTVQMSTPPPPPHPTPTPKPTPSPSENLDDVDVVRVESNLVVVPVSVTDLSGQPVLGLTTKDFRLLEEGREQEIAKIGDPEQVPLDIAILLDVSGSVDARFGFEQQAASLFLKQVLKAGDRATVFAIDRISRHELPLDTADNAAAKIMAIGPAKGPTAFYDTVVDAVRYLAENTPEEHRRVIVVVSDGEDNYSDKVKKAIGTTNESQAAVTPQTKQALYNKILAEVQREVQKAEVTFYSINPSGLSLRLNIISQRAQDGMSQLATATGGTSFVPEQEVNFDAVFRQIAAELRSQYLLQYYSPNESPGKYLRLNVSVPVKPQLKVRSRQGYYAKKK